MGRNKAEREKRRADGLCVDCSSLAANDDYYCSRCRENHTLNYKKRYSKIKETGLCVICRQIPVSGSICENCANKKKKYRDNLRETCFKHYGLVCQCCNNRFETVFLSLDHVNNDGNLHRKNLGAKSIYLWAIKNKFPDTLQTLCHNCNLAKAFNGGVCPHQEGITDNIPLKQDPQAVYRTLI